MRTTCLLIFIVIGIQISVAQKKAEVVIQTSAECQMCKNRLEKVLSYEKRSLFIEPRFGD